MENQDTCPCKDEAVPTPETTATAEKVKENEVPSTVAASNGPTKPRHREEKSRKKDDKSVDHVLKALNSLESTEEKLAAMCKKYADIFDEHRKVQMVLKQTEKRCSGLQREKEQLQTEHSKAILTRSRLENLCRELQRQNKAIKDENLLKIREEEEKRKEVSAKFQNTLSEITALMQQNNDKNLKLRDDNIDMTTKLKNVCEQYELREQQVEKIAKQMQLESQLSDAKLAKVKMEMAAEKEILLREKQQLLMELTQYQARCQEAQATEVSLRSQISLYNDKYDEFQKALERSNNVFGGFKGEMEKMSKKICKLEKETSSWKQRWERSHGALLEMAADKQKSEQDLSVAARQLAALQNLCRTLQTERTQLLGRLKAIETAPSSTQAVEPVKDEFPAMELVQEINQCTKVVENVEQSQNQVQEVNCQILPEELPQTAVPDSSVTDDVSNVPDLEPIENTNLIVPSCNIDSSLTPSVSLVNPLALQNTDNCTTVVQPSLIVKSELSCQDSETEIVILPDVCQNGTEETSDDSNSAESLKHKPTVGTPDSIKGKESSKKKRK